jgi:hypothetical protein
VHKQVQNIIDRTNRPKKEVLNILTFNTHERYQSQLAKTGHNFYAFMHDGAKEWFPGHGNRPDNYYVLPKNTVPTIDFDLILSQSKFGQYQIATQINNVLKLPIVSLEHTLPIPNWPIAQLDAMRKMVGDVNVFISDYSAKQWNINAPYVVIKHSIDSEKYKPDPEIIRLPQVLSVVHDFINRDYCCNYSGWKRVTQGLKTKVVGDTPGLSRQSASEEELVKEYQRSQIFLNTSTISPIPTALLEAMSCGCAVVTTATCMIPEIIENGKNGFLSNDESELRSYIELLLIDSDLREELGKNARQTILDKFSESAFVQNWNQVFEHAYGVL